MVKCHANIKNIYYFPLKHILFTRNHSLWSLWMTNSPWPWTVPHKTNYNSSHMLSCSPPISSMFLLYIMKQQWKLDKYFIGNKSDILHPGFETWKLGDLVLCKFNCHKEETLTYHKQSFVHRKPKTLPHLLPAVKTSQLQSLWISVFLWLQWMFSNVGVTCIIFHNISCTYFVILGWTWAQCLDIFEQFVDAVMHAFAYAMAWELWNHIY